MKHIFSIFLVLFFINDIQADTDKGEALFKQHCTQCHAINARLVGPALKDVHLKYDREWLYSWVKNSAAMIEAGDEQAIAIYEEYNRSPMNAYEGILNDEDIENVLLYIESSGNDTQSVDSGEKVNQSEEEDKSYTLIITIFLILGALVFILDNVKNTLKSVAKEETENIPQFLHKSLLMFSKSKKFLFLSFLLLIVIITNAAWEGLSSVGVYTNYQPEQPIKFSHKIHAGDNGIDCNYCHHTARESKHAGIPSANICMNCHTYINEGSVDGDKEIGKIYDAVGFDPVSRTYIEGYETKPIKWIRIHNLPDLAYFNHAQHVEVGKVKCQTCHGPIEEMDEVYQFAELTMGWCIDCHRTNSVQYDENKYYENHLTKLDKNSKHVHVEDIGGLECGKCHY